MVLAEHVDIPGLNLLAVLKMLIIHDLVEIDAGDTIAYDAKRVADQHLREARAADRIFGLLPPDQAREFRAWCATTANSQIGTRKICLFGPPL